jgi:hypothetical protein
MKTEPKPFDAYEIHGIKEFEVSGVIVQEQVPDDEAEFWSLFGHIPGQGLACIGDFKSRDEAAAICAQITGRPGE